MQGTKSSKVIEKAESVSQERLDNAEKVLDWFISREDVLFDRGEVYTAISEDLDLEESVVKTSIRELVSDSVDPVQQIIVDGDKKVGVIEYHIWEEHGSYGYVEYHDLHGALKTVVCGKCVEQETLDAEVSHATQSRGSVKSDAEWGTLVEIVEEHIQKEHSEEPDEIQPGASLVSGTTVASNKVFHAGNDGDGSNLGADTIDGFHIQKNGTDAEGIINFKT
jgi:hypothetical protein